MFFSQDMKELVEFFEKYNVEYLVVGGFAVNFYGYVRTTQDIDLLVYPSQANAKRVMAALTEFGFGNAGIPREYFEREGSAIHLGSEPNRIDLLTHLQGVKNDQLFAGARRVRFEGIDVNMISYQDLLRVKKSSGRLRDLADAEELEKSSGQQ